MTTGEAIKIFEAWAQCNYKPTHDAAVMAISALRAQQQAETNEPLTLDELRQMEGEPVWFVRGECGCWRILDIIYKSGHEEFVLFDDGSSDPLADYGKDWLAYRHKAQGTTITCTATGQPCIM